MIRAALATLTRIPVRSSATASGAESFGLVGGLVGLAGLVPLVVLGGELAPMAAILAVAMMSAASGALHLDGLADTADALMAPDPATAERARKDPSLGVAGGTALLVVLALEITSLILLAQNPGPLSAGLACVVAGAGSRALAVGVAYAARSRASEGWGGRFARQVTSGAVLTTAATASAIVLTCAAVGSRSLIPGALAGTIVGLALGLWIVRARRQLDGDGLGATVELGFCAILVSTAIVVRWPAG